MRGIGRLDIAGDGAFAFPGLGHGFTTGAQVDSPGLLASLSRVDPNATGLDPLEDQLLTSWSDAVGGGSWTPSQIRWRAGLRRGRSTVQDARLSRSTIALGSRSRWTVNARLAYPSGQRRMGVYEERAAADHWQRLDVDSLGRMRVSIRRPGQPTIRAVSPGSVAPAYTITEATTKVRQWLRETEDPSYENTAAPGTPDIVRWRREYVVGTGHVLHPGSEVRIRGLGPWDGNHVVVAAAADRVVIIHDFLAINDELDPTTVGARRLTGTTTTNLEGALDLELDSDFRPGSFGLFGWLNKRATTQDSVSGGAGIFATAPIGDAEERSDRIVIDHDGSGSPGNYRLRIPGTSRSLTLGEATLDAWRSIGVSFDAATGQFTGYYGGSSAGTLDATGGNGSPDLRMGSFDWAACCRFRPDSVAASQDIIGAWGGTEGRRQWRLWFDQPAGAFKADLADGRQELTPPGLLNGSFETPVLSAGTFTTNPTTANWTRVTGFFYVSRAAGTFGSASIHSSVPNGAQYGVIQRGGHIEQTVTAPATASYTLSLSHARRNSGVNHQFEILVDGAVQGAAITSSSTTAWTTVTRTFTLTQGQHTIGLRGIDSGSDGSSLIDNVTVTRVSDVISGPSVVPPGGVVAGVDYRLIVSHNQAAGTLTLRVDGGTPVAADVAGAMVEQTTIFRVGTASDVVAPTTGALDNVALFRRPPGGVAAAVTAIAAAVPTGSSGTTYGTLSDAFKADTGLTAWYDASGGSVRQDSHGGYHLILGTTWSGIGFGYNPAHTSRMPVDLDNWGVWTGRTLAGADATALHNSGNGVNHAGLSAGLLSGLWSYYNCDERGGDLLDASGNARHLINGSGTFPAVAGMGSGVAWADAGGTPTISRTGRRAIRSSANNGDDAGFNWELRAMKWARSGGTVRFYCSGRSLGSASLSSGVVGPDSGTAAVLSPGNRSLALRCNLHSFEVFDGAQSDAVALNANVMESIRITRTSGPPPLSIQWDTDDCEVLNRALHQDAYWLWECVTSGSRALHTGSLTWSGQAVALPTGTFCSQVFEAVGNYDLRLTLVSPEWTWASPGIATAPTVLASGIVAPITVPAWTGTEIWYDPSAAVNGNGLTESTPTNVLATALGLWTQPNTRLYVRAGTTIVTVVTVSGKPGPGLIGRYGAGADPIIRGRVSLANSHDIRLVNFQGQRDGTSHTSAAWLDTTGTTAQVLVQDCAVVPNSGGWLQNFYVTGAPGTCRAVVIDRCAAPITLYWGFADQPVRLSFTRCEWPGDHARVNDFHQGFRLMNGSYCELRGFRSPTVTRGSLSQSPAYTVLFSATLRGQWQTINITDCSFPHALDTSTGYDAGTVNAAATSAAAIEQGSVLGIRGLLIERCDLEALSAFQGCSELTIRDNVWCRGRTGAGSTVGFRVTAGDNARVQMQRNVARIYRNRLSSGFVRGLSMAIMPTNITPNVNVTPVVAETTGDLTAASFGDALSHGGAVVLLAGQPSGSNAMWPRSRLMSRPAGTADAFAEVPGTIGGALIHVPAAAGARDYRLDAVNQIDASAVEGTSTTNNLTP